MQLALAEGWTQVSPRDTPYTLLLSGQHPGQRLITVNSAFSRQKDLGFSGGTTCPIAFDGAGKRLFFSTDELTSLDLRRVSARHVPIENGVGIFWMLTYRSDPPGPRMLLTSCDPPDHRLGHLDLSTGTFNQPPCRRRRSAPTQSTTTLAWHCFQPGAVGPHRATSPFPRPRFPPSPPPAPFSAAVSTATAAGLSWAAQASMHGTPEPERSPDSARRAALRCGTSAAIPGSAPRTAIFAACAATAAASTSSSNCVGSTPRAGAMPSPSSSALTVATLWHA